ncbi:MAG: alpha/beta hydrolase [Cyclobacteriaceae bacterium]
MVFMPIFDVMKTCLTILFLFSVLTMCAQNSNRVYIWPDDVPDETEAKHEPVVSDNKARNVTRLTDVTNPAFTVYQPEDSKRNGASVIICPGGGYNILAIDLEGHEIAEWLTGLGYTTFVLEYRVPKKEPGALQDLQRAIRLVRANAKKYQIDENKIGVMGFSAGGSLCARASTRYEDQTYDKVDKNDDLSARPDFTMLVYPAYLDKGENRSLTPELKVDKNTPPMFIFETADDKHGNSALVMSGALRDAKVPVEVHLMPEGGHGYGLRPGNVAGETWPGLAEKWLKNVAFNK